MGLRCTMTFRIEPRLIPQLERLARQESTTRSALIERLVVRAIEAQKTKTT